MLIMQESICWELPAA